MPATPPVLDHVVITVLEALEEAAATYRKLGFNLLERGHHSHGSSNHLAIFGENYLELLGFEAGRENSRPDLWRYPIGLTGLVFKPSAVLDFTTPLRANGAAVEEPNAFHRPVRFGGGSGEAHFRTAKVSDPRIANGRIFFCQHLTPELVWRDEWRGQPNGVTDVAEFTIAAAAPEKTLAIFTDLFGPGIATPLAGGFAIAAGQARVLLLTPSAVAERFGGAAPVQADGSDRMVALGLRTTSLAQAGQVLQAGAVPFETLGGHLVVPASAAFGLAITFAE